MSSKKKPPARRKSKEVRLSEQDNKALRKLMATIPVLFEDRLTPYFIEMVKPALVACLIAGYAAGKEARK